jgi:hypothetical protein
MEQTFNNLLRERRDAKRFIKKKLLKRKVGATLVVALGPCGEVFCIIKTDSHYAFPVRNSNNHSSRELERPPT